MDKSKLAGRLALGLFLCGAAQAWTQPGPWAQRGPGASFDAWNEGPPPPPPGAFDRGSWQGSEEQRGGQFPQEARGPCGRNEDRRGGFGREGGFGFGGPGACHGEPRGGFDGFAGPCGPQGPGQEMGNRERGQAGKPWRGGRDGGMGRGEGGWGDPEKLFARLDENNDGAISKDEFMGICGKLCGPECDGAQRREGRGFGPRDGVGPDAGRGREGRFGHGQFRGEQQPGAGPLRGRPGAWNEGRGWMEQFQRPSGPPPGGPNGGPPMDGPADGPNTAPLPNGPVEVPEQP